MENLYCTIFIVDVSQNPEEVETITSRIVQLIEDHGGSIKRQERWGKRRLAYPIRKRTNGYYVEIEFAAQSRLNIPGIVENEYRLNDRVLRYLTYVVTKDELRQRELNASRAQYQSQEEEAAGAEGGAELTEESAGRGIPITPKKAPREATVSAPATASESERSIQTDKVEDKTEDERGNA